MIVETATLGSRAVGETLTIHELDGRRSLRALLRPLVAQGLAAYDAHRSRSALLQILTPVDLIEGAETGRYGREPRALPAAPTLDAAHARAVEAFADELFLAFLDDLRITDLDDIVTIEPHSRLRLVRLVALTG
ncbi:hypothetical protein F6W70_14650 [Microbacterium maritypicum]|uniref:Uncharacterized protein n=1 Tax=Microbacterium maritypicum TaxID=33918 RepID=A0AAD3X1M4_MICMQ|nr:hypothetical protein [Microbacterium liquefaciens]KAB1883825.1 hypothetical protein F6W70_14650 [Microbacterium liquefaciens]